MALAATRFVTCERFSREAPYTLYRVRRFWVKPPRAFGIYLEFFRQRPAETFTFQLRLWRGTILADYIGEELVLAGERYEEFAIEFEPLLLAAKTFSLELLVNGVPVDRTNLDFGCETAE
jgi:hypothetical protein